jgi:hypothetical protein
VLLVQQFVRFPHRFAPDEIRRQQFRLVVLDGEVDRLGDLPSKMIMSQPALLSSAPKNPPEFEQATAPVKGLLVMTE